MKRPAAVIWGVALRLEAPGHFQVVGHSRHDVVLARDGFGLCSCGASECRHLRAALGWANVDLGTVVPELVEKGS